MDIELKTILWIYIFILQHRLERQADRQTYVRTNEESRTYLRFIVDDHNLMAFQ